LNEEKSKHAWFVSAKWFWPSIFAVCWGWWKAQQTYLFPYPISFPLEKQGSELTVIGEQLNTWIYNTSIRGVDNICIGFSSTWIANFFSDFYFQSHVYENFSGPSGCCAQGEGTHRGMNVQQQANIMKWYTNSTFSLWYFSG
jgi:hypothetical protein